MSGSADYIVAGNQEPKFGRVKIGRLFLATINPASFMFYLQNDDRFYRLIDSNNVQNI